MAIRIALADDHPLVLDGLENLFRLEEGFEVVARCSDGRQTLDALRRHRPDVLVLDVRMPGMDGLGVLRAMQSEKLPTRVVLLTAGLDEREVLEAIRMGVRGVVLKEMAPRLLVQAVRRVHAGEQWLEQRALSLALEKLLQREAGTRELARLLTPRELEIVRMLCSGLRNRQIAERLHIAEGTVKVHLHKIYEKLGVDGRLSLLRLAEDKGLI